MKQGCVPCTAARDAGCSKDLLLFFISATEAVAFYSGSTAPGDENTENSFKEC